MLFFNCKTLIKKIQVINEFYAQVICHVVVINKTCVILNFIVPRRNAERGHRNAGRPSVGPCVRESVCPWVCVSVGPWVCVSVRPSVTLFCKRSHAYKFLQIFITFIPNVYTPITLVKFENQHWSILFVGVMGL